MDRNRTPLTTFLMVMDTDLICLVWFMVFNATFNNISVISWGSVLLVEETTDLSQVTDKFNHIISVKTRTVTSLSDTPRLQYYDVQTLEYRYISKLPMKKEQIWSNVQETTSHLQSKLTKNIHLDRHKVFNHIV